MHPHFKHQALVVTLALQHKQGQVLQLLAQAQSQAPMLRILQIQVLKVGQVQALDQIQEKLKNQQNLEAQPAEQVQLIHPIQQEVLHRQVDQLLEAKRLLQDQAALLPQLLLEAQLPDLLQEVQTLQAVALLVNNIQLTPFHTDFLINNN
jgi:hypothetical protein